MPSSVGPKNSRNNPLDLAGHASVASDSAAVSGSLESLEPSKVSELSAIDQSRVEQVIKSGYSRRAILRLMAVTGVSLAGARHLLLSGRVAMAMAPKTGGTVRMAAHAHGPDDQLDPALFTTTVDHTRGRALYNNLVQYSNTLEPQSELAETFEANADASEWTFKIRAGVEFHDGTPLTADDVVYSMNRHLGDESKSTIKAAMATVAAWKKTSPYEVKAIMHTPNADLPVLLGLSQAKIIKNGSTGEGLGTGPFTLETFDPGVQSIHKRNENYWRDAPYLDAIEITAIADPIARVEALLDGTMQLVTAVAPEMFQQIEASAAQLLSTPAALQMGICCLKNTAPGSNDDFVKGVQYIQDRARVVTHALKGKGTIGNDMPITAAHGMDFCRVLPQRPFDPDKAKFHFKKSGYATAKLYVAPVMAGIEDMALLTQANCAKIGFNLQLQKVPTADYRRAVWMREPLNVVNWPMHPTVQMQLAAQFAPGAAWNDTYWNNARMGELLKTAMATTDPDQRRAIYCELQMLVHEHSGMVIPAFANINDAMATNVMGMPTVPLGHLGGAEWPEFIWLA